ncbi:hypothetical protein HOE04_02885 [archaeon]|jgi:hypothetical protein|nr:hypothetical protein [archaeon]
MGEEYSEWYKRMRDVIESDFPEIDDSLYQGQMYGCRRIMTNAEFEERRNKVLSEPLP